MTDLVEINLVEVYEKAGLRVEYLDYFHGSHDLVFFETRELVVDGIRSQLCGDGYALTVTRNLMIGVKNDNYVPEERHVRADGYMHSDYAYWDSPHSTKPYAHGDIDEEVFLLTGIVVGKNSPDYEDARDLADEIKKQKELL